MTKEEFESKVKEFVETSELNYISKEEAIEERLVGLRLYAEPIFGYGSAADPLFHELKKEEVIGPHILLPEEWLEGAATVISYFLPFTEEVKKSNREAEYWPSHEWLHARIEGQRFMLALSDYVKSLLTEADYQAIVPASDTRFQANTSGPYTSNWSERHAAYIGGLGTFGLSKGLITRKGIAGRFGSTITTAGFEPTARNYTGLYDYCTRCGACVKRCPVGTISLEEGKKHPDCAAFLRSTKEKFPPRLGCGKCQTGVPCESKIPNPAYR